jgi:hypothetical protein
MPAGTLTGDTRARHISDHLFVSFFSTYCNHQASVNWAERKWHPYYCESVALLEQLITKSQWTINRCCLCTRSWVTQVTASQHDPRGLMFLSLSYIIAKTARILWWQMQCWGKPGFQSRQIVLLRAGFKAKRLGRSPRDLENINRIHRFYWDICFSENERIQFVFLVIIRNKKKLP